MFFWGEIVGWLSEEAGPLCDQGFRGCWMNQINKGEAGKKNVSGRKRSDECRDGQTMANCL